MLRCRLRGVSCYLVRGPEQCVLVDSGYPCHEDLVLKRMQQHGVVPEGISLILLTHAHIDHIGSARALRRITGAPVAIHRADAEALSTGRLPRLVPRTWLGYLTAPFANAQLLPAKLTFEPDILIDDTLDLREYGVDAEVFHTPGHTQGSVSIDLANGDMLVADCIMVNFPFLFQPTWPLYADSMEQVTDSVRRFMERDPRCVYVSHGGPVRPEDVRRRYRI